LYESYEKGDYRPYEYDQLLELIAAIKAAIPPYCRVNRLGRDIPVQHVAAGNKRSNLREDAQRLLAERGQRCRCIRCREVRESQIRRTDLRLDEFSYEAGGARETFLSFVTAEDRLAGYLRLSLPGPRSPRLDWPDLEGSALLRDLHVYGRTLPLGATEAGAAQHLGLGTELIERAARLARDSGFHRLAVISAVGTREYYRGRRFKDGELYLVRSLGD
jgi:elongator complex protein 3